MGGAVITASEKQGIKAIPTRYGGVEFRSRVEANIAACLDACGVIWTYEQEGYDLGGLWYLPDFWLPRAKQFLEAKGQIDDPSVEKCVRLAHALQLQAGVEDEEEAARPPRVVVLTPPFVERSSGLRNRVRGIGFNGVEQTDSPLCRCYACGVGFFATADGVHECSACGAYQHAEGSFGDLQEIEIYMEHRRGVTTYGAAE